jgi:hypothetical protein
MVRLNTTSGAGDEKCLGPEAASLWRRAEMNTGSDSKRAFAEFMATQTGRGIRIAVGVILVLLGIFAIGGLVGWIIALIGLAPIVAGAMNVCLIAPLLGLPLRASDL